MKKGKILVVLSTIFCLYLASCDVEIGLGAAVDTEAAKLTVNETPRAGDVVRDSFMLSGICTDDTEIKSFTITFKNTSDDEAEPVVFETTPDRLTGEWSIIIDPKPESKDKSDSTEDEESESETETESETATESTEQTKGVPDGEYQVTFKVIDKVNHETVVTRQFRIDNTPPVIVIERPSSKYVSNSDEFNVQTTIDSYGQSFTLEGQSADDNDVKSIEVRVYDTQNSKDPIIITKEEVPTLENVPSRINMDIATFGEDIYTKVYGSSEKEGTKTFYFELTAYDSAVRYPLDGSEKEEVGNSTSTYYLYEDISTDVLSKCKITDLYHMFSGTYKDSEQQGRQAKISTKEALKILQSEKTKVGSFSLNPENSPTFTVTGKSQLNHEIINFGDGEQYDNTKLTDGSSITIEVTPGLDAIPLLSEDSCVRYIDTFNKEDSSAIDKERYAKYTGSAYAKYNEETEKYESIYKFRPYLTECDVYGNEIDANNRVYPLQTEDSEKSNYLADSIKKTGSTYKFTVQLLKKDGYLKYRHNYKIGVTGCDESGNNIMDSGDGYGFRFVSTGAAPIITVNDPKDSIFRVKKGDDITFNGKISIEDGSPVLVILKTNEDDEKEEIDRIEFDESSAITNTKANCLDYDFTFTIPANVFNQEKSAQYKITLSAINDNRSTEDTKTVLYDVDGPNINITDIRPVVDTRVFEKDAEGKDTEKVLSGRNDNINKKITVKGTIDDDLDNVEKAEWKLTQKNENDEEVIIADGKNLKNVFNFTIDTELKGIDEKPAYLTITAYDRAGNITEEKQSFFIDQDTDLPTIEPNDPTLSFEL